MKDHTGKQYGKITMIRYSKPGGRGVGAYWLGQCSCGNKKEFLMKNVMAGRIKTCGECIEHRKLIFSERRRKEYNRRHMARETKRAAYEKGHWDLSPSEFYKLIGGVCIFCGGTERLGVVRTCRGWGYTPKNTVAECLDCRRYRGTRTAEEHLEYCINVTARHLKRLDSNQAL